MVEEKTENKKTKEINLLNDAMFKALFRSEEARGMFSRFLSAVTGIKTDAFLNAKFIGGELVKRIEKEKGKTADIIVTINENEEVIVEANQFWTKNLSTKNTSYAFANFLEKTRAGNNTYPKIILINIDNFNEYETADILLDFRLRDQHGHIENDTYTSFHIILENIDKNQYNTDKEIIKFAEFLVTKDLSKLKEKFKGDEDYMAAFRKVEDLSKDPEFVGFYNIEEARQDELRDATETGIEQGIELAIKNMHEKGISISEIANIMNLEIEKVEKIIK